MANEFQEYIKLNKSSGEVKVKGDLSVETLNKNPVQDIVIEQGVSDIWTYRKWSSGVSECWGNLTTTQTFTKSAHGSTELYKNDELIDVADFPSGLFINTPQLYLTAHGVDGYFVFITKSSSPSTTNIKGLSLFRAKSTESKNYNVNISVKGRWKNK